MTDEPSAGPVPRSSGVWGKAAIVIALVAAIGLTLYWRDTRRPASAGESKPAATTPDASALAAALPRLVDVGSTKCIPCRMMAPILEELKVAYAGKVEIEFVDMWADPGASEKYGAQIAPTQIFFDATGKERFRHEGFFSKEDILATFQKMGVDVGGSADTAPSFSRMEPAQPDTRPAETVCYMCDGDIDPKTRVALATDKGDVNLCSPHCFFITYTSLEKKEGVEEKVSVTDWSTGQPVAGLAAAYLCGNDASGRPTVKAFASQDAAAQERQTAGGNILDWPGLQAKEVANRCGFCDRAVYPEDASVVLVEGLRSCGCCTMCALGVAARLQKDIEVHAKDALTGEPVRVVTFDGKVAVLEPATAVAWAGMKMGPEGKPVSAGCFKQAFFVSEEHLKQWVEQHPTATGKEVTVAQALADKMKLSPQQISKACKIGECAPR